VYVPAQRCKHVNFVQHSLVPGEQEYLFAPYSIFTVRSVSWGAGGAPHRIELDAASDNQAAAEGAGSLDPAVVLALVCFVASLVSAKT
jgi:hypothetical protein